MATQEQKMATSDFNLAKINTKELPDHLDATIRMGGNIAIFGRRGTGKTEISKQEIRKADFHEVYLNMSVMERPDLGGYPNVFAAQQGKEFVNFLMPHFYEPMIKLHEFKPVVLLLDEVDKAEQSLWAPLLELVQFRSINGIKLPNLFSTIMTGNLISEGGQRPSLPLLDRAEKYLVEADMMAWMAWGGKTGRIHPSVAAFITDNPNDLFGAVDPEDRYADPSPRGWTRASDILFDGEKRGWKPELMHNKVRGCVGKEAGVRYSIYFEHYQKLLPLIERIYKGENVSHEYRALDPSQQLIACMIACARLSSHLDQAEEGALPPALKLMGNFFQYVSHENVLAAVRSQVTVERIVKFDLDEGPAWKEIMKEINKAVD
jgi:hypothetical protein